MVDIALISYVMNSPSAKVLYSTTEPVKELKRHTKPKVYVSYNVGSSDRKTYDKTTSRIQKEAEKIITSPLSEQSQPPPLSVERPAQVMVDSISIYYEDDEQVPTASHNAVLDTMTPAMRQKLRARRIRGGDDMTQSWMGRLTIGFYFIAWYVLNVVYNSKYHSAFLLSFADLARWPCPHLATEGGQTSHKIFLGFVFCLFVCVCEKL